jgi:predicted nuclease of predicted toxin-antitoxin system
VRLYLDQMLRVELASLLRDAGHDVFVRKKRVRHGLMTRWAVQEERTLVTIDHHFGDWVVLPLSEHYGVIRVEAHPTSTATLPSCCCHFSRIIHQQLFATNW